MKCLFLLLLVPLAMAQYIPPGPTLPLSQANGGTGAANGHGADAPWLCAVPASPGSGGSAYVCTPTTFSGAAIPASVLASPANGQQMVFFPDVTPSGPFTITIDGTTARVTRTILGSTIGSGDLTANSPYLVTMKASNGRWIFGTAIGSYSVGGGVKNAGTSFVPNFQLTSPNLRGVTGSISGNLTLGTCDTGTATVTGATTAMVAVASPTTNPGTGVVWNAYVSAADTVTVAECGLAIVTPSATTYQVAVIQ